MAPSANKSPTLFALYCGGLCPLSPLLHNPWQGSGTPGCTLSHSKAQPSETGPGKYPLQGVDPESHLMCTPPRRATPPGPPQFIVTGGYGPHPRRLIGTPVRGGYPRYHSILSPPRRASLLVPLPLDLTTSLPPEFCPLPFVCFLCGTMYPAQNLYAKPLPIRRVY